MEVRIYGTRGTSCLDGDPVDEVPLAVFAFLRERETDAHLERAWRGQVHPSTEVEKALGCSGGRAQGRLAGLPSALRLPESGSCSVSQVEGWVSRFCS